MPVLGVCLGAQVLTRAVGAEVREGTPEIGFLPVKATSAGMEDRVLAAFAPTATVFQFHEDECLLPAGAERLFAGEEVRVQAFRAGTNAYGVQSTSRSRRRSSGPGAMRCPTWSSAGASRGKPCWPGPSNISRPRQPGGGVANAFLDLVRAT